MSYMKLKSWRIRTKLRIIDAMGGKCVCCGYNKHYSALELHHLDRNTKNFTLSSARASPKSWDSIVEELRKCVLLCCLCHREIEANIRELPPIYCKFDESYSDYSTAKPTAICSVCGEEFDKNKSTQIYCSNKCSMFKRRKVQRPSSSEIRNLLIDMSMEAVGRKFGVTGNAVRKWLK